MDGRERHRRATEVFLAALEVGAERQEAVVARACGDDHELRRLVAAMLEADPEPGLVLDRTPLELEASGTTRPEADAMLRLPETIDGYRVGPPIGRGGMGIVVHAVQERPRRDVALKILREPLADHEARRRFTREAEVLARLDHPGIASVISAGTFEYGGAVLPYFAMALVAGRPLGAWASEVGADDRRRVRLLAAVADAVDHAHRQGVIHRDLKPANILVTADDRPVVLDFGIARLVDDDAIAPATRTGQLIGTPAYMSPEQRLGDPRKIGPPTDVHALGAILYELLVGMRPTDVDDSRITALRPLAGNAPPPRPSSLRPALRGDLESILLVALEEDPSRRYATAAALRDDLLRWLDGRPIVARPPGPVVRFAKLLRRHPASSAAVIMALLLAMAASAWTAGKNVELEAARNVATDEARAKGDALERLLRLSDRERLQRLIARARELRPAFPAMIPAIDAWLEDARFLENRLPLHVASLEAIEARVPKDETGAFRFATHEASWEHELLSGLVADLRRFLDPAEGTLQSVRDRRARAATVLQRSIADHAEAWAEAVRSVAADRRFEGFRLQPEPGLVPLGPDPDSGLQEFLDLRTHDGPLPKRSANGELRYTDQTGVVFVLIPGGVAVIGAQKADPNGRNFDPLAQPDEIPVHEVRLDPFFVSKFECTQAQWIAVAGKNPSSLSAGRTMFGRTLTLRDPVEQVSFEPVREFCRHLGGDLPTEVQWEYFARAGSRKPFCFGDAREELPRYANLADEGSRGTWPPDWATEAGLIDGFATHAPVGTFLPNDFGLHDVHGNVHEWTLDRVSTYDEPVQEGTGARRTDGKGSRMARGGSFYDGVSSMRLASRAGLPEECRNNLVGFRPIRMPTRAP